MLAALMESQRIAELEAENSRLRADIEALRHVSLLALDERSVVTLAAQNETLAAALEAATAHGRVWRHRALLFAVEQLSTRPPPPPISSEHGKGCCGFYRGDYSPEIAGSPCKHVPEFRVGDLYVCRHHIYRTVKNVLAHVGDRAPIERVAD